MKLYSLDQAEVELETDRKFILDSMRRQRMDPLFIGHEKALTHEQIVLIGHEISERRRKYGMWKGGVSVQVMVKEGYPADVNHAATVHGVPRNRLYGALVAWAIDHGPGLSEIAVSIGGRETKEKKKGTAVRKRS